MTNIISIKGVPRDSKKHKIKDMKPGEMGYTVEWALDSYGVLDTDFSIIKERGVAVSMRVLCIEPGKYEIEYTNGEDEND